MSAAQRLDALFDGLSGRIVRPTATLRPCTPLVVAIHGGTYTSAYFDVPGCSLFDAAAALDIPLVAPDRPGYGNSRVLTSADMTIRGQGRHLIAALSDAWERYGAGTSGIVLIGHSIGAAIAAVMAGEGHELPILGLAMSGVGLKTPPEHRPLWEQLPDTPVVSMPPGVKERVMFGPPGSFEARVAQASAVADVGAPKAELVDIVSAWQGHAHDTLGRIKVPVHYRQGEFDQLWIVDPGEIDGFRQALSGSPRVDARMMRGTGHCMDFHHVGRALQIQQLGFALQCAADRGPSALAGARG
jgi:pimeloyl-ACP methyl ester carboxylesterase